MQWRAAIGFPREQTALRDQVDQALDALAGARPRRSWRSTGFRSRLPVQLARARRKRRPLRRHERAGDSPASASIRARQPPSAEQVAAGHKLFNDNCAHCHGPDAIQGERRINLRLLHHRYGDDMDQVFMTTVTHGRMTKGMPNWSGILTDKQFDSILAFLHSVQEP